MRVVNPSADNPNAVELNFMWLPTFIGQNPLVLRELRTEMERTFLKQQLTDDTLWEMHYTVIAWLESKFPFEGLGRYLKAIEEVKDEQ